MSICKISISCDFDTYGITGGDYEYNPYIIVYTSFGKYRIHKRDNLVCVKDNTHHKKEKDIKQKGFFNNYILSNDNGEGDDEYDVITKTPHIFINNNKKCVYKTSVPLVYELEDYDKMRGDDAIKFEMFCHTRHSGVEDIDKSEGKYVERTVTTGIFDIELFTIFEEYIKHCKTYNINLYDDQYHGDITISISDI